jgi:indole-3-glycerol phosphate synthase
MRASGVRILEVSEEEMAELARRCREPLRGFRRALLASESPAIIAEIKRRSPSRGEIRPDFDPVACARAYLAGGAAALSVLTDQHYFGGQLDSLRTVREAVPLALLRKDFVIDVYQVDETRARGGDAVLLIVAALEPEALVALGKRAAERGLDALVEVHDEAELEIALEAGAGLIGVNNRDLRSFEVDLAVTERLAGRLAESGAEPGRVALVAESGIHSSQDLRRLEQVGVKAFLVGESLMREADLEAALRRLRRSP